MNYITQFYNNNKDIIDACVDLSFQYQLLQDGVLDTAEINAFIDRVLNEEAKESPEEKLKREIQDKLKLLNIASISLSL